MVMSVEVGFVYSHFRAASHDTRGYVALIPTGSRNMDTIRRTSQEKSSHI
jgi:hypothetical protein